MGGSRAAAASTLAVHVSGNHLVDASGNTLVLHGVNRSGTEYMCVQNGGIFDGPADATSVAAMVSWSGVNAVRIPLNEDCWLGINGVTIDGATGAAAAQAYQTAIENYVSLLHSYGLYAILELHWTAPGSSEATYQENLPDYDHSPAMWASVAAAFKNDPATIFDLFNEPNNIGMIGCASGAPAGCATAVAEDAAGNVAAANWWCAYEGTGCITNQNSAEFGDWRVASMQDDLNAVRSTGATNVVMIGAEQFANDPSQWLDNVPTDPDGQLAMSFHVYNFNAVCVTVSCWNSELLPIAASYPVITGEIGEADGTASFIDTYMAWADSHGVSYLAWTWDTWGCGDDAVLISSYSGTACPGYGAGYEAHLASLAGSPAPSSTATPTPTPTATADPSPSSTATPAPGQPTGVAEPSAVSLSWSAPSITGSYPVSSYVVTPYIGAVAQTPINTGSTETSYTATGLTDGQAYTVTVAAVSAAGEGAASPASSAVTPTALAPATYAALVPYRICDTRAGNPSALAGMDAQCNGQTLGAGQTLTIQVTGTNPSGASSGGVPSTATSIVLNVTVTDTTQPSYLTVWPAGGARPLSSSVNWSAGQTVPNLVTVGLSSSGQVSLYNQAGNTDVVVDVEGWLDSTDVSGGPYQPLQPYRICDTRSGNPSVLSGLNLTQCEGQTLQAAGTLTIQAAGTNPSGTSSGGVPALGTLAVDLTVTVTDTSQPSYLTVWPAGTTQPLASNLNFVAGETVANNVVVAVPQTGANAGEISIYNATGNADVVVDVSGYYGTGSSGAKFTPMVPYRICDTRPTSVSGLDDACTGQTLQAGGVLALQVAGVGGIPGGATSVVLNVTVTDTSAPDYLTIYPGGTSRPVVSSLNWTPGETVASGVTATLGSDGELDFYIPNGQADLVVDVVGWEGP